MLQLETSIRGFWRNHNELKERLRYSQLCKRLRIGNAYLGVTRAGCWTDRCSDCKCWDEVVGPKIQGLIDEAILVLEALVADYFQETFMYLFFVLIFVFIMLTFRTLTTRSSTRWSQLSMRVLRGT